MAIPSQILLDGLVVDIMGCGLLKPELTDEVLTQYDVRIKSAPLTRLSVKYVELTREGADIHYNGCLDRNDRVEYGP